MPVKQTKRPGNAGRSDIRKALDSYAAPVTRPKGELIFHQGDSPTGVFIVRRGAVRMTIKSGDSDVLLRIAHEGSVLGLPATMSGKPYSLTARTMQRCELGFISRETLVEIVRTDPSLGFQIVQVLSDEVRTARLAMASSRKTAAAGA